MSPKVQAQYNQTVTGGSATTAVNFPGTGCTYNWVNDMPGIGLAARGTGNIASFTAVNTGSTSITATITATPVPSNFAYFADYPTSSVAVLNTTTGQVAASITVGNAPAGVSVSPDGSHVYVANQADGTVSVIDAATNTVAALVTVGISPLGICVSPDGKWVYVGNENPGSISVINASTNTVATTFPVSGVYGLAVSPDGNILYVTMAGGQVIVINAISYTVLSTIPIGAFPGQIVISPDGKTAYVPCVLNTNPLSSSVYVVNLTTNVVSAIIPVGSFAVGIAISPDGSRLYVTNRVDNTVSVINTANNLLVANILIGPVISIGISVSADGKKIYVGNDSSNAAVVIDASTLAISATIGGVGTIPDPIGNFVSAGFGCTGTPITFTITVNPAVSGITAGAATGNISACAGTASASPDIQQFTVSGIDLTADIVATAPNNFDISLSAASGFGNSVTLPLSGGAVNSTIIYVRSAASASAVPISGNVVLTSGLVTVKVPVTGIVNALPTVNAVPGQTRANGAATSAINFSGTGDTFNWVNDTPGIGLPASGAGNIPSFTAINAGSSPVKAYVTVTPISLGTGCSGVPVLFTITVTPTLLSVITAAGSPTPLNTIYGTPSASTTFTVSGSGMTAGILITPPAGFEVSTDGINFSGTVTVGGTGTIAATTIYIRLTSSAPVNPYSGNIVLSSTGAADVNVAMPVSTVTPAPLTITANNESKVYGEANPVLTVTYSGFVNNDGVAQLTTPPAISTAAVTTSPAGQYPVTASGATDPNYTITYLPGVLTINPQPQAIKVPNTFTPNGDGVNDTWNIKYLDLYPNCTVMIFNRWGQNVYSSIGYGIPWDGTYHGSALPTATYYYIINLKNGLKALSGPVTIIR